MSNKQARTKLRALPTQARALELDELASVQGGLRSLGGGLGGFGHGVFEDTWTWTDPTTEGGLKTKDDE